ncbi:proteasome activator complex subunit 3-like protein, partial [Cricetulus griseus]
LIAMISGCRNTTSAVMVHCLRQKTEKERLEFTLKLSLFCGYLNPTSTMDSGSLPSLVSHARSAAEEETNLSKMVMKYWANFARNGHDGLDGPTYKKRRLDECEEAFQGTKVFVMPYGILKINQQLVDIIENVKPEIQLLIEK